MSDGFNTIDYYNREALKSLRLARWCFEHRELLFFCEHLHTEGTTKQA